MSTTGSSGCKHYKNFATEHAAQYNGSCIKYSGQDKVGKCGIEPNACLYDCTGHAGAFQGKRVCPHDVYGVGWHF